MTGALLGMVTMVGVLLVVVGWRSVRRPGLMVRVAPYVRDVHPGVVAGTQGLDVGALVAGFGSAVAAGLGGSTSVGPRLDRLGGTLTLERYRLLQVLWGVCGFGAAAGLGLVLWAAIDAAVVPLLVFCVVGAVGGVLASDLRLSARVRAREDQMVTEFPAVADLLALAVAAGEGPVAGLERVVRVSGGELGAELGRVLGDIRTGTPMALAFERLARRTGVASISRFAEGVSVAIDRGTPLVDVLHAQAADVREAGRRRLMEAGGRREVAMMIPVVFLILPVTVLLAFFPGYIGLRLTS